MNLHFDVAEPQPWLNIMALAMHWSWAEDLVTVCDSDCCMVDVHSRFQLVWMTDTDVTSNIVMTSITSPFLFVLNPQTHEYYLIDESTAQPLTVDAVVNFFDDISNGSRLVCLPIARSVVFQLTEAHVC